MPRRSKDEEYQYFMELAETDPERTGMEFMQRLKTGKKTKESLEAIRQLELIMSGDESAWQYGSRSLTDALQFLISNTLCSGMGISVIGRGGRMGKESVSEVANMISEDIDFMPMTPPQRRMKAIAESYGFSVYLLTEMVSDYEGLEDADEFEDDEDGDEYCNYCDWLAVETCPECSINMCDGHAGQHYEFCGKSLECREGRWPRMRNEPG